MDGFLYPMKVYYGTNGAERMVPGVQFLPLTPGADDVLILDVAVGGNAPGLYMFSGNAWRFIARMDVLSGALVNGRPVVVYSQLKTAVTVDSRCIVYINSVLYNSNVLSPGASIYVVVEPASSGPGPGADSSVVVGTAVSALSAQRVVKMNGSSVSYLTHTDAINAHAAVGITMESAGAGLPINVKLFGELTEPTWNFQVGKPLFCGVDGQLTQQSPTSGFSLIVGVATGSTKMTVSVKQPILIT